jgi:hypothetical protein
VAADSLSAGNPVLCADNLVKQLRIRFVISTVLLFLNYCFHAYVNVHAIVIAENDTGLLMQNMGKMPPPAAAEMSLSRPKPARQLMLANNVLIFR